MTTNPRPPIEPKFSLKTAPFIGEHVSQIAIDGLGEYAVFTNEPPEVLARMLRGIADHVEEEGDTNGWHLDGTPRTEKETA